MSGPSRLTNNEGSPLNDSGLLFAYGTLSPERTNHSALGQGVWQRDAVRGRLFDLGPYPALVDWDDPQAPWVSGFVRPVSEEELKNVLDPYEGVEEGLFQRLMLKTRHGLIVWTYIYPHPVSKNARGPLRQWDGPRINL